MAKILGFSKLIFELMWSIDANKKYVTGHVSEIYEIVRMIFEQFVRTYLLSSSLLLNTYIQYIANQPSVTCNFALMEIISFSQRENGDFNGTCE